LFLSGSSNIFVEVIGNVYKIISRKFISSPGSKQPLILVVGPNGVGKTRLFFLMKKISRDIRQEEKATTKGQQAAAAANEDDEEEMLDVTMTVSSLRANEDLSGNLRLSRSSQRCQFRLVDFPGHRAMWTSLADNYIHCQSATGASAAADLIIVLMVEAPAPSSQQQKQEAEQRITEAAE
jgi:ABC-type branched-subunit amino acid transport system ATPase component